jgi:hypothetical protein
VELTLTYAAQNAPLRGPFLEVIPETDGGDCPTVTWQEGGEQSQDVRSGDGLGTECGWSVDPGPVPEQGSVTVTAVVPLAFDGADPATELQAWLDDGQARTQAAIGDSDVRSTAYPVQRLQDIQVEAPLSTTSGSQLTMTILPIWPSGEDQLNPLYSSRVVGQPTSTLTAIAGGFEGIRFSDGCSGSLVVSGDGLLVTAVGLATDCTVITTVGNLTDRESNPFDITTRGS